MPRHPIGKPVKVVPSGDVPAALKWVGYAKKRAWELLAQGTWRRKVIHPDADTTIRIETLAGIPRVMIEVRGGEEYILLTADTPEYPYSLVGGPYKAGAATQKHTNIFGATTTTSRHIQRMANDWYLFSARGALGTFGNSFGFIAPNMQLVTISSPWTYFDSGAGQTLMGLVRATHKAVRIFRGVGSQQDIFFAATHFDRYSRYAGQGLDADGCVSIRVNDLAAPRALGE